MSFILDVNAREILDSRANPTVEVEVLLEDGYGDMYGIMKQLVRCGCDALISVDHASHGVSEFGGMAGAYGYSTGYMKGMLLAAEREVAAERSGL